MINIGIQIRITGLDLQQGVRVGRECRALDGSQSLGHKRGLLLSGGCRALGCAAGGGFARFSGEGWQLLTLLQGQPWAC